jgi:hypothetical protein
VGEPAPGDAAASAALATGAPGGVGAVDAAGADETVPGDVTVGAGPVDPVTAPLVLLRMPEYPTASNTAPLRLPTVRPVRDPLAVAVGNASLLGVGYGLLGRWMFAVLNVLVTVGLVATLVAVAAPWLEFVVVGWWVAVIVHGWFLAGGKLHAVPPAGTRTHRIVAAGLAVVVLAAFGLLRWESASIDDDVAAAQADGDCAKVVDELADRSVANRIVDAPGYVDGDELLRACGVVDSASRDLRTALSGDTAALASGYRQLGAVLRGHPEREPIVAATLDGFLDGLPAKDACDTAAIADWLTNHGTLLDRADKVVAKVAPSAFVDCADQLMSASDWPKARDWYQQLLDEYPDDDLKARATQGVTKATQAIELAELTDMLAPSKGTVPRYCNNPVPYSAAPPYPQPGANGVLLYGNDEYLSLIPPGWKAGGPESAVVILCAGETEQGAPTQTCPYTSLDTGAAASVTFYQVRIPVKLYEVRTGRLLADTTVEVGGASCPDFFYGDLTSSQYVTPSVNDVALAFQGLLVLP